MPYYILCRTRHKFVTPQNKNVKKIYSLQASIDEVENLLKKHEAFEKACTAQEERFAALERLTTVSYIAFSFLYL